MTSMQPGIPDAEPGPVRVLDTPHAAAKIARCQHAAQLGTPTPPNPTLKHEELDLADRSGATRVSRDEHRGDRRGPAGTAGRWVRGAVQAPPERRTLTSPRSQLR